MSDWQDYWATKAIDGGNSTNLRPEYYDPAGAAMWIRDCIGKEGGSLLDVGCGNGLTLFELKQYYPTLTGIDYSPSLINWCREYLSHIATFTVGDARHIPFRDESFDNVVSYAAIQYFDALSDAQQMVNQMYRVCRPGGTVIVGDVLDRAEYTKGGTGMGAYLPDELAQDREYSTVKSFFEPDRRFDLIIRKPNE